MSRTRSLSALFKQGCNEIPEVLAAGALGTVGCFIAAYGVYRWEKNDGDNKRFKNSYVVIRPDDPRVKKIRHDDFHLGGWWFKP